jgi:purine nucleosidase
LELLVRLDHAHIRVVEGAAAPIQFPDSRRRAPDSIRSQFGHRSPSPGYAAAEIASLVAANPGEITVVAIGPLTNIAAAVNIDPDFASNVKEIVIMGGVFLEGTNRKNMPGEFNFWIDPEAADAVLRSGAKIRVVGLDVTQKVRLTRSAAERMRDSGLPFSSFAGDYTLGWIDHMSSRFPGDPTAVDSCALHDPLAIAALTHPEFMSWSPAHVGVVTGPSIARGAVVADFLSSDEPPAANALIATKVDANAFVSHFVGRLGAI